MHDIGCLFSVLCSKSAGAEFVFRIHKPRAIDDRERPSWATLSFRLIWKMFCSLSDVMAHFKDVVAHYQRFVAHVVTHIQRRCEYILKNM